MRFLLRLLMLQRDVTFRLARRGPVKWLFADLGMPVEFNYCGMLGNVNLWIRVS